MNIIYLDNYHYFNETIMPESPLVIKVGVCGLDDLIKMRHLYPKARIFGVEADPVNLKAMETVSVKTGAGVELISCALAKVTGHARLYKYTNKVSHSLYARHKHDPNCVLDEAVNVPAKSPTDLLTVHTDLLILNCEGSETFVMDALYKHPTFKDRFSQICMSFHVPRIYPTEERDTFLKWAEEFYHIIKEPHATGIPDVLLIRKEQ